MKSEDIDELGKNASLLDKYVNIANKKMEKNTGDFGDGETGDDRKLLDEMFQEKLKKNLKVCETLDKTHLKSSYESSLEESLKKTLEVYSGFTIEEEGPHDTKIYFQEDPKDRLNIKMKPKFIQPQPKVLKKPFIQNEQRVKPKFDKPHSNNASKNGSKPPSTRKTEHRVVKPKKEHKRPKKKNEKSKPKEKGSPKSFFSNDVMQKIRFLHYKTSSFEQILKKRDAKYTIDDLQLLHEYVNFLNVNYKTQSQIKIIKELEINPTYFDPIEKRDIRIWDLMLECGRVYSILAKAYFQLSKRYENKSDFSNAIICMVNSSKAYKTAAFFSAANTRQKDVGQFLTPENLELKSEEARIIAQNLAIKEKTDDLFLSSKMYSGLSALLNRLNYLKSYQEEKKNQMKALVSYYKGKSCHLKAKAMINSSDGDKIYENEAVINFQKKANYYFLICEEIWEHKLKNGKNLGDKRRAELKRYLSTVNEEIMENDVELINSQQAEKIQDPDPYIAVPENMSYCIPKYTKFLTNYPSTKIEKKSIDYVDSEQENRPNEIRSLRDQKAGMGRTLKQIKKLYENGDLDINKFTELYEKYSTRISSINTKIKQLKLMNND